MHKLHVIGGLGFVGSSIVNTLKFSDKFLVTNVSNKPARDCIYIKNLADYRSFLRYDIPDIVILAIGSASVDWAELNPEESENKNYTQPANFISEIINCNPDARIIIISTIYVFDQSCGTFAEDDLPQPGSVYGKSKFQLEQFLSGASQNWIVIRLPMLVGNPLSASDFFLGILSNLKLDNPVFADPNSLRYPTDIMWVVDVLQSLICNNRVGIFHLSSNKQISKYSLAERFIKSTMPHKIHLLRATTEKSAFQRPNSLRLISKRHTGKLNTTQRLPFDEEEIFIRFKSIINGK